jgi:hypothetical protein
MRKWKGGRKGGGGEEEMPKNRLAGQAKTAQPRPTATSVAAVCVPFVVGWERRFKKGQLTWWLIFYHKLLKK